MNRFAARLLDHAARIMPSERRGWVQAMRAELDYIADPWAAFVFALGCVWASYTLKVLEDEAVVLIARLTLALFALICAGGYALAAVLMVGIKATPGLTPGELGVGPGTAEILRFYQDYPVWRLAALPLIAVLLIAGAVLLAWRRSTALPLMAGGLACALLVAVFDRGADWPLAWSSDWPIVLMCLGPIWWLSRRAPDLRPA